MKISALIAAVAFASAPVATGPNVGSPVPDFHAVDTNGQTQSLTSIMGPHGALLVFFRSADW